MSVRNAMAENGARRIAHALPTLSLMVKEVAGGELVI
jgi:hypothetical protein